jgi:hypothetical protein
MTLQLSQYLGEEVIITHRDGSKETGVVKMDFKPLNVYEVCGVTYNYNGQKHTLKFDHRDIVHIERVQKPMNIDLSQFVNKDVYITLRNGDKKLGCVAPTVSINKYWVAGLLFCKDGGKCTERIHDCDIIHIELAQKPMTKYEQLQTDLKELKALREKEDAKIKELEKEIESLKEEEKKDKLPEKFNREFAIKYLETQQGYYLKKAFCWATTPQKFNWYTIYSGESPLTDKDIIQIQKWIIMSYQQPD